MRTLAMSCLAAVTVLSFACTTERRIVQGAPPETTESPTEPSAARTAAEFCSALCDRTEECDRSLDHQTCKNQCKNHYAAVFPKLRDDVADLIVTCFEEQDCKSVLDGDVITTCTSEAVAQVAPSDDAVAFCDSLAKARQKCGLSTSKAECLASAKLYDDGAIAEAANCTERACASIDTCVAAAFAFGTPSPTPARPEPTCGSFPDAGSCASCAETCCDESTECWADPACRSLAVTCANQSYDGCYDAFQYTASPARDHALALLQCARATCNDSCAWTGLY